MKILDLYCGAGGCSRGYVDAGFEVVGVDCRPQPRYPFRFIQTDALTYLETADLRSFDLIHASPPCQAYSLGSSRWDTKHPDLLGPTRTALQERGVHYVIENVKGAPLQDPIILDGQMFGLKLLRKRLFETNWPLEQPPKVRKQGRVDAWELSSVAGHGSAGPSDLFTWRLAMGISWMERDELIQAIPPKYTEYIGRQFIDWHKMADGDAFLAALLA